MKYLRYALLALLLCIGILSLGAIATVAGPVIYLVFLIALLAFFTFLIMSVFSLLWSLATRKRKAIVFKVIDRPIQRPNTSESKGRKIYDELKDGVGNAKDFIQRQLSRIWTDVEEDLARLSLAIQKRSKKSKFPWMRKRIEDMIEDHKNTFDLLSQKMNDHTLDAFRSEYMDCCRQINELEREIGDIKASIAMKGEEPGGAYHRILGKAEEALKRAESSRLEKIEFSRRRLEAYGVNLNPQQAEVLLSRVDAGDIMQMTTVFSIISNMTRQFASAKLQSGENLDVTKKYYGMYIALLELQLFIQNHYLDRLGDEYIPGIHSIAEDADDLYKETLQKAKRSENQHKVFYENNLKSQMFTLEVTGIYKKALVEDAQKVKKARDLIRKHHEVAENTLKTVQVSADLSALMTQNESLYRDIMELQMPDLVPFENLQMQREFEAVTIRLREGG